VSSDGAEAAVEAGTETAAAWTDEFLNLVKTDREQGLLPTSEAYKQVLFCSQVFFVNK
jgi:hypothetical protein